MYVPVSYTHLLFQLGKCFFGQRVVTEEGALANIIQIARMNEGFFRERGLFLHSGKFRLLFGEGLTGFGKRLRLLVGLGGQACLLYTSTLRPEVKVYGVQAEGAPSMYRSLHEHK